MATPTPAEQTLLVCQNGHVLGRVQAPAGIPRLFLFRETLMNTESLGRVVPEIAAIIGDRAVVACSICTAAVVWHVEFAHPLSRRSGEPFRPFHNLEFKTINEGPNDGIG